MVNIFLKKVLDEFHVTQEFAKNVREEYREDLEKNISAMFSEKPNFRYGGSIAKGTANTNSCDIDLLCYMNSDCELSVEDIFRTIENGLPKFGYIIKAKNSAICVMGTSNEGLWDMTVDVVPGKYTSNEDNKDVYLWCNRDKCRLKSNPELQINKVKNSNSKDVIRLLKIFRGYNNFKFKSFFLELFAIDIVESEYNVEDSLYDKIIKFCKKANKIGISEIYDPANANNNIMNIHSEYEFSVIRNKINELYEALMTNDKATIKNCLLGNEYSIDQGYLTNAKEHSKYLNILSTSNIYGISLECYFNEDNYFSQINSNQVISKQKHIKFIVKVPVSFQILSIQLIISNAGYESYKNNCLRGDTENMKKSNGGSYTYEYYRSEYTSYYGKHVVQVMLKTTSGRTYYSKYFIVNVGNVLK